MDSILCNSRKVYLESIDACMRHMCQGVQQICFDPALHIGLLSLQGFQGCLGLKRAAKLGRIALWALPKLYVLSIFTGIHLCDGRSEAPLDVSGSSSDIAAMERNVICL